MIVMIRVVTLLRVNVATMSQWLGYHN